jgi:hypothetical protein
VLLLLSVKVCELFHDRTHLRSSVSDPDWARSPDLYRFADETITVPATLGLWYPGRYHPRWVY